MVVITSPNYTHAAVLADALATDKHVLIEKPLCTTVDDCKRVVDAAADRDAITWMGLQYRFMPTPAAMLEQLATGVCGNTRMVSIREHRYPFLKKIGDWNRFTRNTGGTLVEKCCHFFDLMHLAAGAHPVRVMASGGQDVNHLDEEYEIDGRMERPDILDNTFVIVEFANGVHGALDLCMFAEGGRFEQEITITGDLAKMEATVPGDVVWLGEREPAAAEGHGHNIGKHVREIPAPMDPPRAVPGLPPGRELHGTRRARRRDPQRQARGGHADRGNVGGRDRFRSPPVDRRATSRRTFGVRAQLNGSVGSRRCRGSVATKSNAWFASSIVMSVRSARPTSRPSAWE